MIDVEIELESELLETFQHVETRIINKTIAATLNRAAKPIEERVKQLAPEETGALEGSIRRKTKFRYGYAVVHVGINHRNNPSWLKIRALAMEYGNLHVDPHPFLAPAIGKERELALDELFQYADRRLANLIKKSL